MIVESQSKSIQIKGGLLSQDSSKIISQLGIRMTWTMPIHLQSDGMVESFNRTLEQNLLMVFEENQIYCVHHYY